MQEERKREQGKEGIERERIKGEDTLENKVEMRRKGVRSMIYGVWK